MHNGQFVLANGFAFATKVNRLEDTNGVVKSDSSNGLGMVNGVAKQGDNLIDF